MIVGQDTDGSVTPHDLGMDWIVNLSKGDFVGRRSLRRSDVVRPDRKQLVGLFPDDTHALAARRGPARARGHRPDPDAARGPRHLVVPEPGARAHVRARDAGRGSRRCTAERSTRRCPRAPWPARSRRPSPTTPTESAVTARSPLAERSERPGPASTRASSRSSRSSTSGSTPRPRRASASPPSRTPRRRPAIATCCGSGRTSGSSSAPRARAGAIADELESVARGPPSLGRRRLGEPRRARARGTVAPRPARLGVPDRSPPAVVGRRAVRAVGVRRRAGPAPRAGRGRRGCSCARPSPSYVVDLLLAGRPA